VSFIKKRRRRVAETFSKLAECIMRRHEARGQREARFVTPKVGGSRVTRRFPRDAADGSCYLAEEGHFYGSSSWPPRRSRPCFETRSRRSRETIYGIARTGVYGNSCERGLRARRGGPINSIDRRASLPLSGTTVIF